jgi:O-antigen ligase
MSSTITAVRPRLSTRSLTSAQADQRRVERRVGLAWGLLVLNVLTFTPGTAVIPIPGTVGKLITQAALPVALFMVMTVNRRGLIRSNVFLCLVSLLLIDTIVTCVQAQYLRGTLYRTFRATEFVAALWLLTPYWGRRDLLLVRCHMRAMAVVLGTVVLGLIVSPGHALRGGRLLGAIWPIPATQVAHYAAVTLGLAVVLWFSGHRRGRRTLLVVAVTAPILLLTHTRTALVALILGIVIAGLSLVVAESRVRKLFAYTGAVVAAVAATSTSFITAYLDRGQGTQQLTSLTGRTNFWAAVLAYPRNWFQEIFGFGLSNGQFNGLPIDSNWLESYQEQGLFGVAVCATILVFLIVAAYFQPRGVQRALALFLVTYSLVASFTEVGFTDVTTYLLDLTVAASLLAGQVVGRGTGANPSRLD